MNGEEFCTKIIDKPIWYVIMIMYKDVVNYGIGGEALILERINMITCAYGALSSTHCLLYYVILKFH